MPAISILATLAMAQSASMASADAAPAVSVKLVRELMGIRPLAFAPAATGSLVAVTLENRTVRIIDAKTIILIQHLKLNPMQP